MINEEHTIPIEKLKGNRGFLRQLRLDIKPADLFTPRFVGPETDRKVLRETNGYMFYIDFMKDIKPTLMLMRTIDLQSQTAGEVSGAPAELLEAAVKKEGVKEISGMYPIDNALEAWLRKELGVQGYKTFGGS